MDALSEKNWLIVGLGNPGLQYERTRHNLGFMLIDRLAREAQTQVKREECRALIGRAEIEGERVEFVKPQTFMNLSGEAINCLLVKPNRSAGKLIVITDDLALPIGTMCLRTKEFIRLRIGIQPEHPISNTKNFVLEKFSKTETETIEKVLERTAEAIRAVVSHGIEKAMAEFN